MDAQTSSPIFPNIYANELIPATLDVDHQWCQGTWDVDDVGVVEILGLSVQYSLDGSGHLDFDDPEVDLLTDLVITIPQLGCSFNVYDIAMTGFQEPTNKFVDVSGTKYIPQIFACGARWSVDADLRIYGFLDE